MSVRNLNLYGEWSKWDELAKSMAFVAAYKIVHQGICGYGWRESASSVIDITQADMVDYARMLHWSRIKMARGMASFMSMFGVFGEEIDLSDDLILAVHAQSLVEWLAEGHGAEPLKTTPIGKAWVCMCGYLKDSDSFKALLAVLIERKGGRIMRARVQKYGLAIDVKTQAYFVTEASFKEAYPRSFRKSFWSFLLG